MKGIVFFLIGLSCAALNLGCSTDDETGSGGSGGSGGQAAGGAAQGGAGAEGGMAGMGGMGGMGGDGGSGGEGAGSACIGDNQLDDAFSIAASDLCLVAKYTAPFEVGVEEINYSTLVPTWGRHGGPVTLVQAYASNVPQDEVTLVRWQLPNDVTGSLSSMSSSGPFGVGAPVGDYFASQAIDLPGTTWTMLGYSNFSSVGKLVAVDGTTVGDSWDVTGYYSASALPAAGEGRMLFSGKSELGNATPASDGLYAADFCAGPALCGNGSALIDAWGTASGAVAVDSHGNAFATQTGDAMSGDQVLRAYHADDVAHGQLATSGVELWSVPGFGSALAAIAPDGIESGIVLFQPQTFSNQVDYGDVSLVRYQDQNGVVSAVTSVGPGLSGLATGKEVTLMADDLGRIWVGMVTAANESTFYVLARKD